MEQGHVVLKLLCIWHEINSYLSSWQVYNGFSINLGLKTKGCLFWSSLRDCPQMWLNYKNTLLKGKVIHRHY